MMKGFPFFYVCWNWMRKRRAECQILNFSLIILIVWSVTRNPAKIAKSFSFDQYVSKKIKGFFLIYKIHYR